MKRVLWLVLAALVILEPVPGDGGGPGQRPRPTAHHPAPVPAGGVLRMGVTSVSSLDPAQARAIEQLMVVDQVFDSLTALDPTTQEPVPALAARWQVSADQRQWDFFLRPGAAFHNGRPITAADVKYSLERVSRPGSGSPGAELLQLVAGYAPFRVQASAPELVGVSAPAPDVVHISLDHPWAVLPTVLASPVLGVVPREAVEAQPPAPSFLEQPVGSGPFQVRSRQDDVISLTPSPGATAALGGVEIVQFEDVGAAYRAFTRGELDWARVPPEQVDEAAARYGRHAFSPYLAELFYGFNLKSPKLADPRFREAIVRGIDRRAIVTAVYHGTVRPTDGMVLEGVAGFEPGACSRCAHDPAAARALLAQAFPGSPPPEIALDYDDDESQEAVARSMQASLQEVGIAATLRPRPLEEYDDFVLSGGQEVFRLGWIASYSSPDAFLHPLFASGSGNNLTGFADPAVDAQLQTARAEGDPARRAQLYRDVERAVLDQLPVIPIAQFQLHTVVSKRVRGFEPNSTGSFDASLVWLAGGS